MIVRDILVKANYGWPEGNKSAVIQVPETEMDNVEKYVRDWVKDGIVWSWEDITNCEEE